MEIELKESEERYREIFNKLGQGYYEVDLKGNYTFANKFHANYLGYSKNELVGINFRNFFDKETEKRIFETYNEVYKKNLPKSSIEIESVGPDGKKHIFEATIYLKYDPNGKKIGFYGTTYDITERKKAETEIARLAKFPSENPNPVLRVTSEKILYINHAGIRLFEIQEGSILPESLKDAVNQAFKEGTNQKLDVGLNNRIYSFTFTPIKNEDYVNIYGNDITERKKAEKEITSLAKFPSENPNPILRVKNKRIVYINQAGQDLFKIIEGNRIPELLQDVIIEAFTENVIKELKIEILNQIYSFVITPIIEAGYTNIYGRNITMRKNAELKLRENEEHFRLILQSIPSFVVESDFDGIILSLNKVSPGFSFDDFVGKSILDAPHPKGRYIRRKLFNEVIKKGIPVEYEAEDYGPNKSMAVYKFQLAPVFKEGKINSVIMVVNDITDRIKTQQKIRESEERYRILFNSSPIGIGIADFEGNLHAMNKKMQKLTVFNLEEINDFKIGSTYVDPAKRKELLSILQKHGTVKDYEVRLKKKDGTIYIARLNIEVIEIDGKKLFITNCEDITERKKVEQKLKESEMQMRLINNELETIIDSIPALAFYKDKNGRFIRVNQYLADYFNLTKEEIIGKFSSDFFSKEQAEAFRKINLEVINSGKPKLNFQELWEGPYGPNWSLTSIIPRYNEKNEVIGLIGFIFDVTKQKLAEETIHERNKEILALLDASRVVLQYRDFEKVARSIFEICANLTKATAGYIGLLTPDRKGIRMVFLDPGEFTCEADPDYLMPIIGLLKEVINSRKTLYQNDFSKTDFIKFLPKEHIKLNNILIAPLIFNNEVQGFMGLTNKPEGFNEVDLRRATAFSEIASIALMNYQTLQSLEKSEQKYRNLSNILEQKVDERTHELKESQEKIHNLINNISDALMEANQDGTITFFSPQIFDITGYHPDELLGHNFIEYIHPEDLPSYKIAAINSFKTREPVSIECRIQHKKGFFVPVSTRGNLVELEGIYKVISVIRDNTERQKIDDMIKKEIKKLKNLDQIRSDLIRRISHELNTPLISIFSGAQYLLNYCTDKFSEDIQNIIKIIHNGGYRLKELVDNLIIAYEIESVGIELNLKRENLISIIKNCIENIIIEAEKRKIFMNIELLDKIYLNIDKLNISRVIINLLSNAIKNTPANGNIFISTFEHPNYIDIIIKDTGVGLTKREIPVLFRRFGKIERYGKGLDVDIDGPGLGLYISNEIIKQHNGKIIVKSKGRNKGCTFIIRLCIND